MSDKEVILSYLQQRSTTYFALLYTRYFDKVFSKCLGMLKDDILAQDVTQEIFLKVYLNLPKFNKKSSFSTWLFSITYNQCIDYIRKKKKEKRLFSFDLVNYKDLQILDEQEFEVNRTLIFQLEKVLDKIPSKQKAILLMKYQQNMSIREIAEVLSKTESAIKMQLKRAKTKVRNRYKDMFSEN